MRDEPAQPDDAFADLYAQLPEPQTLEPWLSWAMVAKPPVLYLGIGVGRMAAPLHRAGIRLVGVDAHPRMLAYARVRLPQVELVQAQIEHLDLGRRFDLVMVPSNILCTTQRLERAAVHVAPGGRLAFELTNPHWLRSTDHADIRVRDFNRWQASFEIDYHLPDARVVTQVADVPLIWPEDAQHWLNDAGLRLEHMMGSGLDGDLETSPTFYVTARTLSAG